MFKLNCLRVLIFTVLISKTYCELKFNNLQDNLVLQLLQVKPYTNLVGSSLMVRFPLCKLASVATGEAKQELLTALGYKDNKSLSTCYTRLKECIRSLAQTDLTYVNKIFVNYREDINPSFIANSTEKYGVQVEKVGFKYPKAAVSYINRIVATGTFKRIVDVLDSNDLNKDTNMVMVSGIHFKGTWEFPFDVRRTKLMKFHHFDGKISTVPMMSKIDSFSFIAGSDCQLLSIKFGAWRASITFVLPNTPTDLPNLLDKIQQQPNYINSLVKQMKVRPMKVILPRIKIKTYIDWTGFLQELGLYSIFKSNSSDLSGILKNDSTSKNLPLSKVKQKIFLQIDELGVARFTLDPEINDMGMQEVQYLEDPKFQVDRPFYFEITFDYENARYNMFTGVYYGPEPGPIVT